MPNFSIALTGLQANTIALNTIGNNLANLNTTAFKKQTTSFEDLLYQNIGTSGSGDTLQVGVGVRASSTSSDFAQGSISTTDTETDVALNGAGYFLVQRGNVQALTRAGNFQLDPTGNLITTSGESVMGYGVNNGVVNLNGGLLPLALPVGVSEAASATKNISLGTSLDASAATGVSYPTTIQIYDSLGTAHTATVTYQKTSNTTWHYAITLPALDATGPPVNNQGTLTFDPSGKLVNPATNVTGVQFTTLADGAADLNFNFDLYDSSNNPIVTQTSGTSSTVTSHQDGFAGGTYQSFAVNGQGIISATFSNGQTTNVGQIAVATVTNQRWAYPRRGKRLRCQLRLGWHQHRCRKRRRTWQH